MFNFLCGIDAYRWGNGNAPFSQISCPAAASCSLFLVESVVQSAESLHQKSLLLLVDVCESFDVLGSLGGHLIDGFGLAEELAALLGFLNYKHFSESFLGCWLASLGADANRLITSETLGCGVMEAGEIHWIAWELLISGSSTLWLHQKGTVMLGQLPQNTAWNLHVNL